MKNNKSVVENQEKALQKFVTAIHQKYSGLSANELRLADLILESPGEVCAFSATELANLAKVSNSTVSRFCRKIGFDNYDQMRIAAREVRNAGSPLFLASNANSIQNQKSADLMLQFENCESEILKQTIAQISPELVDELTTALLKARNLGFMGFRNGHYFAGYARWQFIQFRKQTRLIPGPGETVAERIADLNERDIVVVIGIRRIVGKIKRYLEVLHQNKVRILLITDPSARVAPAYAKWTISCPVETPHVFDSYAGVLAVIRLLAFETFRKSGLEGRQYMEKIESRHETLEEFE